MKEIQKRESSVNVLSNKDTTQLRTRIPAFIRDFMGIENHDKLVWHAIIEGDKTYVIIEKKEQQENE